MSLLEAVTCGFAREARWCVVRSANGIGARFFAPRLLLARFAARLIAAALVAASAVVAARLVA
jgi:hypothetical protein